jgi:hypothetical protein
MKASKLTQFLKAIDALLAGLHNALHGFVLFYFKNVNRRFRSKLPVWKMEIETSEHLHMAIKAFKRIVLPLSLLYVCADFYFFGRNALDSALWGLLIFFYSNFVPDFPSIFRRKKADVTKGSLPWYKKYALLLFAPLLIVLLFSGLQLGWRTTETFHNFRSLTIYGAFLLLLGFLLFGNFPMSIGRITEILSPSFYGAMGYMAHLKVDGIW